MDPELDALVTRADDPHLIPGIYTYCNSWCDRCRFTERCLTFRENREYEARHPDRGEFDQVHHSFQQTFALLEAWCEREGIDFQTLREDAVSEASSEALRRKQEAIDADPLQKLARSYSTAAFHVFQSLDKAALLYEWAPEVRDAIDVIMWYSSIMPAKLCRALHALAGSADGGLEWDVVQNDWNGSAKVARLGIAESRKAWDALMTAGQATPDSTMRRMIELLDRIDAEAEARFPRAMEFVRPGFDEPEVAAGGLTSLGCKTKGPR